MRRRKKEIIGASSGAIAGAIAGAEIGAGIGYCKRWMGNTRYCSARFNWRFYSWISR